MEENKKILDEKFDSSTLIEQARKEREGLMAENERLEKNLRALREVEASRLLGSTAGTRDGKPQLTEAQLEEQITDKMANDIAHAFR